MTSPSLAPDASSADPRRDSERRGHPQDAELRAKRQAWGREWGQVGAAYKRARLAREQ